MEDTIKKRMMIFAGNSNPELGREIANYLGLPLGKMDLSYFSNGEIYVRYLESVRGADVFVVQSVSPPVNTHLMELLIMIDAAKRASAKRISAVIPHYGYSRQDHKAEPREPITARLVADLLTTAGTSRVLTMDLHSGQIQGFFNFPLDHLTAIPLLANYFLEKTIKNLVVVSPDVGRVKTAKKFADRLQGELAILHKGRPQKNVAQVMQVVGDVKDKNAIMIDDMIDTGGTLMEGLAALKAAGAKDVYACATHPILSGSAVERFKFSEFREIVVTNTIPIPPEKQIDKFMVLSIAPVFGQTIRNVYEEQSVSEIFGGDNQM
jgi:ribose-phosphate pyrophosphokinase